MSKKIILGVYPYISSTIELLSKNFNLVVPRIMYDSHEGLNTNFDYYFLFDSYECDCLFNELNSIGSPRYQKSTQSKIMTSLGINHPHSFKVNNHSGGICSLLSLLDKYNDKDTFIFKYEDGARGLLQYLLTKGELYGFIEDMEKMSVKDFKKKYEKITGGKEEYTTKSEIEDLQTRANFEDFYLTKKIDVLREYRVIAFYKQDPIIFKRNVNDDHWQSNLVNTGSENTGEITCSQFSYLDEVKKINEKILKFTNSPFMSIDYYIDSKDNLGVFEFQMQFGIKGLDKTKLQNKMISAVNTKLKDKLLIK